MVPEKCSIPGTLHVPRGMCQGHGGGGSYEFELPVERFVGAGAENEVSATRRERDFLCRSDRFAVEKRGPRTVERWNANRARERRHCEPQPAETLPGR